MYSIFKHLNNFTAAQFKKLITDNYHTCITLAIDSLFAGHTDVTTWNNTMCSIFSPNTVNMNYIIQIHTMSHLKSYMECNCTEQNQQMKYISAKMNFIMSHKIVLCMEKNTFRNQALRSDFDCKLSRGSRGAYLE